MRRAAAMLLPAPLLAPLLALLLAGCASLTPDQCRHADWRQIGFTDGMDGESAARINEHAKACAEVGVRPDFDQYLHGREQGLRSYCRPENGFMVGRSGNLANAAADCPEHMKFAFMAEYRRGQEVHLIEDELSRRRSRINHNNSLIHRNNERIAGIREELAKKDLPDERRGTLLKEFNHLVEQKDAIGRENLYLASEADRLQFQLQMTLRAFGR